MVKEQTQPLTAITNFFKTRLSSKAQNAKKDGCDLKLKIKMKLSLKSLVLNLVNQQNMQKQSLILLLRNKLEKSYLNKTTSKAFKIFKNFEFHLPNR